MTGALDQVAAPQDRAGGGLHRFHGAGPLVDTPILLAGNEAAGHVDAAAGKCFEFGIEEAGGAAAIPLQAALESGAGIFGAVEAEFLVRQPLAGSDLRR